MKEAPRLDEIFEQSRQEAVGGLIQAATGLGRMVDARALILIDNGVDIANSVPRSVQDCDSMLQIISGFIDILNGRNKVDGGEPENGPHYFNGVEI